jgi:hypothetical protein
MASAPAHAAGIEEALQGVKADRKLGDVPSIAPNPKRHENLGWFRPPDPQPASEPAVSRSSAKQQKRAPLEVI